MINKFLQIKRFIDRHPLSGRHKVKAYTRFISWQLAQFFYPHEKIVSFVGDTRLSVTKGMTGATGNIYTGLHDFSDMGFLLHFLRKGDLFFDIGANVGSYTILASGYVRAKTLAIEPVPSTFGRLIKNIELNQLKGIAFPLNIGLGRSKSSLNFTKNLDTVNHVVYKPELVNDSEVIAVPVETFDNIADEHGIPILIKIDVEGFETEVMEGMANALKELALKAIIIELNGSGSRYGFDENLIEEALQANGFFPYTYEPFKRNLERAQKHGLYNTIYIRDIAFVIERVKNAEKVKVFSEEF